MPKKSSNTPSNTTQQEELGPRVTDKASFQIGEKGEKRVSIIPTKYVTPFIVTDTDAGRFAIKVDEFLEGELTDIEFDSKGIGRHRTVTFTVKLDDSGEEKKIIAGQEVQDYFFKEYLPSGGKNKRKNRKSTKSKKSKKSKKSRKNRKKTIRRR